MWSTPSHICCTCMSQHHLSVRWSCSMQLERCILRRSGQAPSVSTRASPSFFSSYSSFPVVLQCSVFYCRGMLVM